MQFQVTEIEFDFESDDAYGEFTEHHFDNVIADTLENIWKANDEDDLIEKITSASGWCVKSIDCHILTGSED